MLMLMTPRNLSGRTTAASAALAARVFLLVRVNPPAGRYRNR